MKAACSHPSTDILHLQSGRRLIKETRCTCHQVHATHQKDESQLAQPHHAIIRFMQLIRRMSRSSRNHTITPYDSHKSLYKEGLPPTKSLPSPSKDLYAFLSVHLRFLWQRRGLSLQTTQAVRTLPHQQQTTSSCRLQPIYYSCVSATIRLSKILVHTPSLAPLPHPRGPGHMVQIADGRRQGEEGWGGELRCRP